MKGNWAPSWLFLDYWSLLIGDKYKCSFRTLPTHKLLVITQRVTDVTGEQERFSPKTSLVISNGSERCMTLRRACKQLVALVFSHSWVRVYPRGVNGRWPVACWSSSALWQGNVESLASCVHKFYLSVLTKSPKHQTTIIDTSVLHMYVFFDGFGNILYLWLANPLLVQAGPTWNDPRKDATAT